MSLYVYEEYSKNNYNAISKARKDASSIALKNGFQSLTVYDPTNVNDSKIKKAFIRVKNLYDISLKLKKDDILFVQADWRVLPGIIFLKELIQFKIVYLIHDAFFVKYDVYKLHKKEIKKEVQKLNKCNYVICHNEKMKNKLIEFGVKTNLFDLGLFDYLIDSEKYDEIKSRCISGRPIVTYAGDITKSPFIYTIDEMNDCRIRYMIYGKCKQELSNIEYKGAVDPDQLPFLIEGNYGLVWDGNYVNESADYYSRYNNPHKISMHIVSGMPVIVWSGSALASYIKKEGIGIVIDTLDDINEIIPQIDQEQYSNMINNCIRLRENLMKGDHLSSVLKRIVQFSTQMNG